MQQVGQQAAEPAIPCFVKDTPVETDQGTVAIQDLRKNCLKYSIGNQQIKGISKTMNESGEFVCIEQGAIAPNVPDKYTITTKSHLVQNAEGTLVKAKNLVNDSTITLQNLGKQFVYNVLLENHSIIKINNMDCETLNPKNLGAKKLLSQNKPKSILK